MQYICSYYIWFVIFFGEAHLFILYLVRHIFWCSTSVHTIFGSSYFLVQHICSYHIWFVIFLGATHVFILYLVRNILKCLTFARTITRSEGLSIICIIMARHTLIRHTFACTTTTLEGHTSGSWYPRCIIHQRS